jgi:hypothetical protein
MFFAYFQNGFIRQYCHKNLFQLITIDTALKIVFCQIITNMICNNFYIPRELVLFLDSVTLFTKKSLANDAIAIFFDSFA